jgi:hypothetical protein
MSPPVHAVLSLGWQSVRQTELRQVSPEAQSRDSVQAAPAARFCGSVSENVASTQSTPTVVVLGNARSQRDPGAQPELVVLKTSHANVQTPAVVSQLAVVAVTPSAVAAGSSELQSVSVVHFCRQLSTPAAPPVPGETHALPVSAQPSPNDAVQLAPNSSMRGAAGSRS